MVKTITQQDEHVLRYPVIFSLRTFLVCFSCTSLFVWNFSYGALRIGKRYMMAVKDAAEIFNYTYSYFSEIDLKIVFTFHLNLSDFQAIRRVLS